MNLVGIELDRELKGKNHDIGPILLIINYNLTDLSLKVEFSTQR